MAITVNSVPPSYSSAHDALWFVVSSNNSTQTNFKYVFDVQVGGVTVATVKNFPDEGGYGVFDAAPIIRNYFASGFSTSGSSLLQYADGFLHVDFTVIYGEQVGAVLTTNLTSSTAKGWNFALNPFRESISLYANKFLTTRDRAAGQVVSGEKFYITYFNATNANVTATIQKLNEDGSNDGSASTGSGLSTAHGLILDLSPFAINTYLGSTFITASTYAWRVTVGSDSMTVKQVCAPRFTPVQLVFQNKFGGYDSFTFRLLSRQSQRVERSTYKSNEYRRVGTSMTFKSSSGVHFGGNQAFAGNVQYGYRVISDYLSAADYELGSHLIASNEAYLYKGGDYFPIIMSETSWQEKNETADKIFNYELNFDLGVKQQTQYR
jgi:hypothetical protein